MGNDPHNLILITGNLEIKAVILVDPTLPDIVPHSLDEAANFERADDD